MTIKTFYFDTQFKAVSDENDIYIEGMASTADVDRMGDIIQPEAWSKGGLDNFKKNPIILFNHNYNKPIGKAVQVASTADGLYLKAKISKAAGDVLDLIKDGILGAFSVGFRIKDADYIPETDGFKIKDAELFEVSVVSIPANQAALFNIAKSFESPEEYEQFKKTFKNGLEASKPVNTDPSSATAPGDATKVASQENKKMSEVDIQAIIAEAAEKTAKALAEKEAQRREEERLALEATAKKKAEEEEIAKRVSVQVTTAAERLVADIEKRFADKNTDLEKLVNEMRGELKEKSEEILKIRESKRVFEDRGNKNWKDAFAKDLADAHLLGLVSKKGWESTKFGKDIIEKVNQHSGVEVSSADFEQIVSTNIERDIQNELILQPMFREIAMSAASLILPILPDANYADFVSAAGSGPTTAPRGTLEQRGNTANGGIALTEKILTTKKLISKSYLGNETEEDAIMPILPLIRESMVRSHARAIEQSILLGGHTDQATLQGTPWTGLAQTAKAWSNEINASNTSANYLLVADDLLKLRKAMGKYGVRPDDVIYVVSQRGYFELLQDADFQDMNLVGNLATKVNGQVGQVFGSRVLLCDEFKTPAANTVLAVAVNTRNFVVPRLRGLIVESDYSVENQHRVLVASQRLGFDFIHTGVANNASVASLKYNG